LAPMKPEVGKHQCLSAGVQPPGAPDPSGSPPALSVRARWRQGVRRSQWCEWTEDVNHPSRDPITVPKTFTLKLLQWLKNSTSPKSPIKMQTSFWTGKHSHDSLLNQRRHCQNQSQRWTPPFFKHVRKLGPQRRSDLSTVTEDGGSRAGHLTRSAKSLHNIALALTEGGPAWGEQGSGILESCFGLLLLLSSHHSKQKPLGPWPAD
jgi:hypothetical protein